MTANKITATQLKYPPAHKNAIMDFRAPGLLAKWPVIGLIMFIFGSLVFAGLTYNLLAQGPLLAWDRAIANTLPAIALKGPGYLKGLMDAGYIIGDQAIMVLGGLIALYLLFKRYWKALWPQGLLCKMVSWISLFIRILARSNWSVITLH